MKEAFLIVGIILFVLAAVPLPAPTDGRWPTWSTPLVALGLAFFASSFLGFLPG